MAEQTGVTKRQLLQQLVAHGHRVFDEQCVYCFYCDAQRRGSVEEEAKPLRHHADCLYEQMKQVLLQDGGG